MKHHTDTMMILLAGVTSFAARLHVVEQAVADGNFIVRSHSLVDLQSTKNIWIADIVAKFTTTQVNIPSTATNITKKPAKALPITQTENKEITARTALLNSYSSTG